MYVRVTLFLQPDINIKPTIHHLVENSSELRNYINYFTSTTQQHLVFKVVLIIWPVQCIIDPKELISYHHTQLLSACLFWDIPAKCTRMFLTCKDGAAYSQHDFIKKFIGCWDKKSWGGLWPWSNQLAFIFISWFVTNKMYTCNY